MKSAPKNLTVNFCNWLQLSKRNALEFFWVPLRDCVLDARSGLTGASSGDRIAELTEERAELTEENELLRDEIVGLQRENLLLHAEIEQNQADQRTESIQKEALIKYLMGEKTRLSSINADLASRLAAQQPQTTTPQPVDRLDTMAAVLAQSPIYRAHQSAAGALLN